jgi:hypothetical protein
VRQTVGKRDPEAAEGIFPDRPLAGEHRHEVFAAEPSDGVGRADPGLALVVHGDGGKVEGEAAGRQRDLFQTASAMPPEAVLGADPEAAGPVQKYRLGRRRNFELGLLPQTAPLGVEDPPWAAGPERAGAVRLEQGVNGGAGLPERALGAPLLRQRAGGEDSVGIADEMALLGADPERAVVPFRQIEDPVAPQRRHPLAVEHLEVSAVEAHQAVEGGQPEETVARLEDLGDPRCGQAVAGSEDLVNEPRIAGKAFDRACPDGA